MTVVNVREKPPLRLTVEVETPSGRSLHLGDNLNNQNTPQNLSFGSSMPGGFDSASFDIIHPWWRDLHDLRLLSSVRIAGAGGSVAWEGRVDSLPEATVTAATLSPQLTGWQAHLDDDNSVEFLGIENDLSGWHGPSNTEQKWLTDNDWVHEPFKVGHDSQGYQALQLTLSKGPYSHPHKPRCEIWYDAKDANIGGVWYDLTFGSNVTNSNFSVVFGSGPDDHQTALTNFSSGLFSGGSEVQGQWLPNGSQQRYLRLYFAYTATPWAANHHHFMYARLILIGDHRIQVQAGNPIGLLASDVIAHVLRQWCPLIDFTQGREGTLEPSSFAIPQVSYPDPTTASQIVSDMVAYENLDWAVWDGRTFYLGERGNLKSTKMWQARASEIQLSETGPSAERLWNGVVVSWTNQAGQTMTVGPPKSNCKVTDERLRDHDPENPANQLDINRYGTVSLSTSPTTSDALAQSEAIRAGERYLQEQKKLDRSGSATVTGHILDDRGVIHPYWRVRAGDYIQVIDARDTSPRRIVSTSCDDTGKTNSLSLDQPPDTESALLQRLSVEVHRHRRLMSSRRSHHHHHHHG